MLDAEGSESAVVYADGDAGPLGLLFAAMHPDRVRGLILFSTGARFLPDEDYPIGMPPEFLDGVAELLASDQGAGEQLSLYVPSRADDTAFLSWMGRLMRATPSPSRVRAYMDGVITADARAVLDSITVPTLVLHPTESQVPQIELGRYLADHISTARLVELSGPGDAYPYFALAEQVLPVVQEFVAGVPMNAPTDRMLATVLFTDIVESTARARDLGDERWRTLLDRHDELAVKLLDNYGGHLVKNPGDGILVTFDGPGRAIRFGSMFGAGLRRIGLDIRTSIHTGEIELRGDDVGGLAVHLGARIMAAASPSEILVSRTVKDLVIGSTVRFVDRGTHSLKGIEGDWQLFAVGAG